MAVKFAALHGKLCGLYFELKLEFSSTMLISGDSNPVYNSYPDGNHVGYHLATKF